MSLNKNQSGFTLLEVMVAIVVLSLGLLGLAGLQAATLRNNQIAYYRAIAVQQTFDMADRIRANQVGVAAGAYNALDASIPADPGCVASTCTAANMAVADHSQWNNNNARMLPGGSGTVASAAGGSFVITISWNENTEAGSAGQQFVTSVVP
ncbi:MAG: type IV pilus modification protein PilV [Gammaproteobacteria bacterium]|nr:type IV pilus modification protein PilV [Gammaproteobacteria bacterium]